ncbi:MAG: glycosyltransferase [Lachnospiraceae bacterium]|jgi:cellulose synthase (UDP-forming)|nr:glycosyltransferase [Lachnospiraceae bacterium]
MNTKKNKNKKLFGITSVIGAVLLIIYILWRALFTIPGHEAYGWIAFIAGIALLVSEALSIFEAVMSYIDLNLEFQPEMPVIPDDMYPEVDVMIATHNEDVDLLFTTANACRMLRYPDKKKVHVWICDDNNRPEMKSLADSLGVGYIGLSGNKLAKAGNLNNAISKTNAPLIATFDSDMIPNSEFLLETVPYFFLPVMKKDENGNWIKKNEDEIDKKEKIGFIQTPQSFYNSDLFQYNLYSSGNIPNEQDYFFRQVNIGKNRSNSAIYAGSNTVISREALESVGGIATGTITEDFETGLLIEGNGYRCYAVNKLLAKGLSPISIPTLFKQRERWARGCIFSLRRVHIMLNPKFKLSLKLSYLACGLYWLSFARRLVYIISPLLFSIFRIPVVICTLKELLIIWLPSYAIYSYTLKKISGDIRNTRWSNTVDTILFPYLIIPIFKELIGIRKREFSVTNKSRSKIEPSYSYMAAPHIVLLFFSVIGLFMSCLDLMQFHSMGTLIVIYWILQNAFNLLMAVFFMTGRNNERMSERLTVNLPVKILFDGRKYEGTVVDISEGGLAFIMDDAIYFPHQKGELAEFMITDREYKATVKGRVVAVKEANPEKTRWKYCVINEEISFENKEQYNQIIYDREHTLPKTLSSRSNYIGDIMINLEERINTKKVIHPRATARIPVNEHTTCSNGLDIIIKDFNFEYMRLEFPTLLTDKGKKGKRDDLPETLTIFQGEAYEMRLVQSGFNQYIYRIENFSDLEHTDSWKLKLRQWQGK